jgi:IS1 family transposase
MRIDIERAEMCLRMLLEGNSVRSTERLTGTHRDTILRLLVLIGERAKAFMADVVYKQFVADVEIDEIWGYVGCKEKTRVRHDYGEETCGDFYCFTGMERTSKLMLAYHLGKRTPEDTTLFLSKLGRATTGRFQATTDGYGPYASRVPQEFGNTVDYAMLVKNYSTPDVKEQRRYSPPQIVEAVKTAIWGSPDESRICTSHIERSNLSIRMGVRRMTRLTNAFSKKVENHEMALALFFCYYNFCRVHQTLKTAPAVAAGMAVKTWSVRELLEKLAG